MNVERKLIVIDCHEERFYLSETRLFVRDWCLPGIFYTDAYFEQLRLSAVYITLPFSTLFAALKMKKNTNMYIVCILSFASKRFRLPYNLENSL